MLGFCVRGACVSDVCGDIKGASSHDCANRQFLKRKNEEFKQIPTSRSTVTRTPRPQVPLAIFRAGQMEAIFSPPSI